MKMEVTKISIIKLVVMFLFYVITHSVIGIMYNKKKEELKGVSNNTELRDTVKFLDIGFKWYPAIIVVVYIIILYS